MSINCWNDRIMQWKYNVDNGQIVAGGNGEGNTPERVNYPIDVIVDKKKDMSLTLKKVNLIFLM